MKYSVAVMLLLGAISSAEAVQLHQMSDLYINNAPVNNTTVQTAQLKAKEAANKAIESKNKVDALKAQRVQISKPTQ